MPAGHFSSDDPLRADVTALLRRHLEYAHANTAPEDVFALDVERLVDPAIAFFSFRDGDGALLAVGALKHLDPTHAEIKSMHTAQEARRRGIGRAMVAHLLDCRPRARLHPSQPRNRLSARVRAGRALYEAAGFEPCDAFADYRSSEASAFMTIALD